MPGRTETNLDSASSPTCLADLGLAAALRSRLEAVERRAGLEDGVGFDVSQSPVGGYDLRGMRERAERVGGALHVERVPGAGTRVRVDVPR